MTKETKHPMPPKRVRRHEVIEFMAMAVGDSLVTDNLGVAAIIQYGRRHGMVARCRKLNKKEWRVWRAK